MQDLSLTLCTVGSHCRQVITDVLKRCVPVCFAEKELMPLWAETRHTARITWLWNPIKKTKLLPQGLEWWKSQPCYSHSLPALQPWNGLHDCAAWPETSWICKTFSVMLWLFKKRSKLWTISPKIDFVFGPLRNKIHTCVEKHESITFKGRAIINVVAVKFWKSGLGRECLLCWLHCNWCSYNRLQTLLE